MSEQLHVGEHVETGEVECEACIDRIRRIEELSKALAKADVQSAGDTSTIRSLSYKLEELRRDKDAEAREHELWDDALDLFGLWLVAAAAAEGRKKKKSQMTGDRFWLVLPFLKKHGTALCQRAIIGRIFDHFKNERANGSAIHYCEWERIFGAKGKGSTPASNFEESANCAPEDWRKRVEAYGFAVPEGKP